MREREVGMGTVLVGALAVDTAVAVNQGSQKECSAGEII